MNAHEAVGEDAAAQERAELARGRAGEERLELCLHDLIEHAVFRLASRVGLGRRAAWHAVLMEKLREGSRFQLEPAVASFVPRSRQRPGTARALENAVARDRVADRSPSARGPTSTGLFRGWDRKDYTDGVHGRGNARRLAEGWARYTAACCGLTRADGHERGYATRGQHRGGQREADGGFLRPDPCTPSDSRGCAATSENSSVV